MRQRTNKLAGRREVLALGAGSLGALALNGSPLSITRALAAARPALPNFYPAPVAPPDIPGNANGLEPGYTAFPKRLVKLVDEAPGRGGDVTAFSLWVWAIPSAPDQNAGWTQVNKQLNANIKMNYVPQPDYAAKWGTVTAGGDLPDLMYISPVPQLPNVAAFTNAACVDLSEHLGGDAVKAYPALANIPTASWRTAVIDNKLWGVPIPRSIGGWPMFVQTSLLEKLGMAGHWPTNADEFKAFCKALTNPAAGRWAMGVTNDASAGPFSMYWFQGIFGAPNNWRLKADGTLVKSIETDEYKAALAYNRELVQLGYIEPDVRTNTDLTNDLLADKIVMRANGWAYYKAALIARSHAVNRTFRIVPPFGHDGGPGTTLLGTGNVGWVAMKKGSPDRIRELLGILNYLASPIGSTEHLATRFGVEGVDWNYNSRGTPTYTRQGLLDMPGGPDVGPWGFVASPAPFLFSADVAEFGQFGSDEERKMLAVGVADPTLGYYSATNAKIGSQLEQLIFDTVSDIAAGRKPMGALDQLVSDWKARGGDRIRAEYEKAIAG